MLFYCAAGALERVVGVAGGQQSAPASPKRTCQAGDTRLTSSLLSAAHFPPLSRRVAVGFCIEGQYLGEFLLFTAEELMGSIPPDEANCLQLVQGRSGGAPTVELSPIRVHAVGTVVVQLVEADEVMRLFAYDEAAVRAILGEARLRFRKIMDCHMALAGVAGVADAGAMGTLGPNGIVADVPAGDDSQRAVPQQFTLPGAMGSGSSGHGQGQPGDGAALAAAQASARVASIVSSPSVAGPPAGAQVPLSGQKPTPKVINDFFGSSRVGGQSGSYRPPP